MPTPLAVAADYADRLVAAGIRATTDPTRLVPPVVLFTPPTTVDMDINCGGTARFRAVVAAGGGPASGEAWRSLEAMLAKVLAADVIPVEEIAFGYYDVGDGTPSPPVYELTWAEPVDWIQQRKEPG